MKRFDITFIIALAISALALLTAYADGESRPAVTVNYPWYDSLQELNELCRLKHRQSRRYEEYARHALEQRNPDIAALFMAMSRADAVQCANCRRAIESLGGRFDAPAPVRLPYVSVGEHLGRALRDKEEYHRKHMGRCIECAVADGNRYIARILTWCDASDLRQIPIRRREIERLGKHAARDSGPRPVLYNVCPRCGNVTESDGGTRYCPHCMTEGRDFASFR